MSDHTVANGIPEVSDAPSMRLSDRLASLAPPAVAAGLAGRGAMPERSPAVKAALAATYGKTAKIAKRAERHMRPRRYRTLVSAFVESFVSACSFVPYALVALGLRALMAFVFFTAGQAKVFGPQIPLNLYDYNLSVTLPAQLRPEAFSMFMSSYASMPLPPAAAAYVVTYAQFVLPILLVLGLATRFAALGLLLITALLQLYVLPNELWTAHIYWGAILIVLMTRGPGELSVDHIVRYVTRR
ncbi:MAG: DoxX family protein [Xanthobacteraceae bacterium]|uniref:DoxX family protein n=1 Tax=Pseudolabrys sp. TaxID=1960880 RepID=UPI003D0BDC17